MTPLQEYVWHHSEMLPNGEEDGTDVFFFRVRAVPHDGVQPDADTLRSLLRAHPGEFGPCDPLDGKEHSYIELGGWIGDQGLALRLIGLGDQLKVWKSITPNVFKGLLPDEELEKMAGIGMVSVLARP